MATIIDSALMVALAIFLVIQNHRLVRLERRVALLEDGAESEGEE